MRSSPRTWLIAALVVGCAGEEQAPPEPIVRPVRYVVAEANDGPRTRKFSGSAQASEQSRLSFRVSGPLKTLAVKVGDTVKKGDLIAELDATDLQLKVSEAAASRAQAKAMERSARSNYERIRKLYEARGASRADLDSARANADSARMSLSAANQGVALLKRQVDYAKLKAPAAGNISQVNAEVGENVNAGAPVATLQSGDDVEVIVAVPASVIGQIEQGAAAQVSFAAIPGADFPATVFEVGVASGQATTYPVTLRFEKTDPRVRPGMAAEATFTFAPQPDAKFPRVPPSAVGEDRDGRFVFKVTKTSDGQGTVKRHPVQVGELSSAGLQIREGVANGDLVVTAGVSRIKDGLVVRVPEQKAQVTP